MMCLVTYPRKQFNIERIKPYTILTKWNQEVTRALDKIA